MTPIIKESERSPMGAMKKIMQENPDIVNMSIGEPISTPGGTHRRCLPHVGGQGEPPEPLHLHAWLPPLRQAIARYMKKSLGSMLIRRRTSG